VEVGEARFHPSLAARDALARADSTRLGSTEPDWDLALGCASEGKSGMEDSSAWVSSVGMVLRCGLKEIAMWFGAFG
jgi:hypothetical protein